MHFKLMWMLSHYGKLKGLSQIIDENARFTMKRGDKLISNTKEEVLQAMKGQENVEQNCQITQSVVETLPNQMIVKIDMKYKTFTRTNFVTISEAGKYRMWPVRLSEDILVLTSFRSGRAGMCAGGEKSH